MPQTVTVTVVPPAAVQAGERRTPRAVAANPHAVAAPRPGVLPTARAAQGAGLLLWFTMMFLSGTDGPLDLLPGWLLDIGKALPLYHLVQALESPWNAGGFNGMEILVVLAVGFGATLASLRVFRWE